MHEYNSGKCRSCSMIARFEEDEETGEPIRTGELQNCAACKSVQYCCKEHQAKDWPKHKKFCKRFRNLINEYKVARSRPGPKPAKPTPYPLHDLIELGDWQGLLQYLTKHPTYDVNGGGDSPDFMSPLLLACGQGQILCVSILLDHGATTNEDGPSNLTPLVYASWWGHADIVQMLLNRGGADVNQTTTHSVFALGMASQHLQPHVVELLLRHGANVDQRSAVTGWTSLMNTVLLGCTDQPGGDDERSDDERKEEDVPKILSIVKMLLEAGADVNARAPSSFGSNDNEGDTALNYCAAGDDKIEVVELLISSGALLDTQRKSDGRNALLCAAEFNAIAVVELLIRAGADTTVRDSNGRNYIDLGGII